MINNRIIKTNIKQAIQASGLSQTEIAKRLGIKQQSIAQYISGRSMPALDTFANLCVVLDIDPAEILGTNNHR